MKNHIYRYLSLCLVLVIALVGGWLASPAPAMAVAAVTPSTVMNTFPNTLLVTSTTLAFVNPVKIEVLGSGYGLFDATIGGGGVLFVLPAGFPAGQYTLRIHNGDSMTDDTPPNALTVIAPTSTPLPTATPAMTNTPFPTSFVRPLVTVLSYGASSTVLTPGQNFDFEMTLQNTGQITATNIVVTFVANDFVPRATGGVRAVGDLAPGQTVRFFQPFTASTSLAGQRVGKLEVKADYTDVYGTSYSETFTLTFDIAPSGGAAAPTATPTLPPALRPQLVISDYSSDVAILQPGTQFTLQLEARNLGNANAKAVTLILGGGGLAGGTGGTPESGGGGVAGSSGEFTNFAPLGSSNLQFLGDLPAGAVVTVNYTLIVNVSTKPGAYPLKLSFVYTDERGNRYTDDQVITLLVYALPQLEISFYRDPNPIYAGQPNALPLQVVNLGRNTSVLGNMEVNGEGAEFINNVILVGALDPGGYFTLDATVIPEQAGQLELNVTISYTDDFGQSQTITQTLTLDVLEAPMMGPEEGYLPEEPSAPPETFWQAVWRFIRGLLGLDSGRPSPTAPGVEGPLEVEPEIAPPGPAMKGP
jgi:uncharacterized repeat protein (TIGR01451 family)